MKRFYLKMPAYHFLERNHYVSISEAGDLVTKRNSRVRYFIELDTRNNYWVYYRFTKEKDEFDDYIMLETPGKCAVFAVFDQVSKFNPF